LSWRFFFPYLFFFARSSPNKVSPPSQSTFFCFFRWTATTRFFSPPFQSISRCLWRVFCWTFFFLCSQRFRISGTFSRSNVFPGSVPSSPPYPFASFPSSIDVCFFQGKTFWRVVQSPGAFRFPPADFNSFFLDYPGLDRFFFPPPAPLKKARSVFLRASINLIAIV